MEDIPLPKCSNFNQLEKSVKEGEVSRKTVRGAGNLSEVTNIMSITIYLCKDGELFIVLAAEIDGDHILTIYTHSASEKFQCTIDTVKCWCRNKEIGII